MNMYRLHLDIPLGTDEEKAIKTVNNLSQYVSKAVLKLNNIDQVNYRVGHDEDRQKSNYLDKNENGHVSNKKFRIDISG